MKLIKKSIFKYEDAAYRLAMRFHELYEELAPLFDYHTRPESRKFNPASDNGRLMIEVCRRIIMENYSFLEKRLNYWASHDLKNGWSFIGPCCHKCRMTDPSNPLHPLIGCRDPFQINCECHLPVRNAIKNYMVQELTSVLAKAQNG